jgi:type IV secretory pathway TraG/TraD family ATPase VirD4
LDPTSAELTPRRTVDPARMVGVERLCHGRHCSAGGVVEGPHKVVVGQTGSAKNQAELNYEVQHQLEHSDEHMVLTDVKANAEMSRIVYAYAREGDRIFVYNFHPQEPVSSSLRLFRDPDEAANLAFLLTDEPTARESHWNEKAAELIVAVAEALTELERQAGRLPGRFAGGAGYGAEEDEITATLNEVWDVIADRERLKELIRTSPRVANVADVEKEWGYIRSGAARRLSALRSPSVRRVFAARPETPQPDFSRRDGRDIVVVRPHAKSAPRLARYIYAALDVIFRAASDGGDAGGPGTKFVIDEAASYMRLQNLPEYLDLGRASKVQVTYALQGTKQLITKLGRDEALAVLSSTEIKVVGATSDLETARVISELSEPRMVHYRRPVQRDELLGQWGEHERPLINPHEITGQSTGEFTVQQGPKVWKVQVPEERFHHRQAAPPREREVWGVVDAKTYEVPPILGPPPRESGDGKGGPSELPSRSPRSEHRRYRRPPARSSTSGGAPGKRPHDAGVEAAECEFCGEVAKEGSEACETCGAALR